MTKQKITLLTLNFTLLLSLSLFLSLPIQAQADECTDSIKHFGKVTFPTMNCLDGYTKNSSKFRDEKNNLVIFASENFLMIHQNPTHYYGEKALPGTKKFLPKEMVIFAGTNVPFKNPSSIQYQAATQTVVVSEGKKKFYYSLKSGGGNIGPDKIEDINL